MSKDEPAKISTGAFVFAGLSYIPLIGVAFGIVSLVWALVSRRAGAGKVAALGAGGIVFTIAVYSALFYFGMVQRGGVYDGLRTQMAESVLGSLVPVIEFYKVQNGAYPAKLDDVRESVPETMFLSVYDPTDVAWGGTPRLFFYERVGEDHYYLRSVGVDGKVFTPDDIVPKIDPAKLGKAGLLLARASDTAKPTPEK